MDKLTIRTYAPIALLTLALTQSAFAAQGKQVEKLDRGVIAIATGSGVFISWRVLGVDEPDTRFNLYRDGVRLNDVPLEASNFTDGTGTPAAQYAVRPVVQGQEKKDEPAAATWNQPYLRIPVQRPAGGVTPKGEAYTYDINDGTPADLDGERFVEVQPARVTQANAQLDSAWLQAVFVHAVDAAAASRLVAP